MNFFLKIKAKERREKPEIRIINVGDVVPTGGMAVLGGIPIPAGGVPIVKVKAIVLASWLKLT